MRDLWETAAPRARGAGVRSASGATANFVHDGFAEELRPFVTRPQPEMGIAVCGCCIGNLLMRTLPDQTYVTKSVSPSVSPGDHHRYLRPLANLRHRDFPHHGPNQSLHRFVVQQNLASLATERTYQTAVQRFL